MLFVSLAWLKIVSFKVEKIEVEKQTKVSIKNKRTIPVLSFMGLLGQASRTKLGAKRRAFRRLLCQQLPEHYNP